MRKYIVIAVLIAAVLAIPLWVSAGDSKPVSYPENYRDWSHIKSMVINPEHALADPFEGIHHIYANSAAKDGLKSGQYKDGAVLVFDLLSQNVSGDAIQEGERKFIGVMEFDAKRFAQTGGWGFEAFAGDSKSQRVVEDGGVSCFGCHQAVKADGYVFTKPRD